MTTPNPNLTIPVQPTGGKIDLRYNVPGAILSAARQVAMWASLNGHKDWELEAVASRDLVDKLRAARASVEADNAKLRNDVQQLREVFAAVIIKLTK